MSRFQSFKSAHKANAPDLLQAEIARGRFEQAAHADKQNRRAGTTLGAVKLYNDAMGKDTPIKDYLTQALRNPNAPEVAGVDGAQVPVDTGSNVPVIDKGMTTAQIDGTAGIGDIPLGFDTNTGMVDPMLDAGNAATAADTSDALRQFDFSMPADSMAGAGDAMQGLEGVNPEALEGLDVLGDGASATDAMGNVPVLGALNVAGNLAAGDTAGAAKSAGTSYLATLGPYGMLAAALLSLT